MNIWDTSTELFDDSSDSTFDSLSSSISSDTSIESSSELSTTGSSSDDMFGTRNNPRSGSNTSQNNTESDNSTDPIFRTMNRSGATSQNTTESDNSLNASDATTEMSETEHSQSNMSEPSNESNAHDEIEREESLNTAHSSDTEAYDVDAEMERLNGDIIEINDTQMPDEAAVLTDDDDDVILIPERIETIDLCTQQVASIPRRFRNEVIDITNSPTFEDSHAGPIRRRINRRNSHAEYQTPIAPQPAASSLARQLDLSETLNDSQPRLTLTCPICLDSIVNRHPVSTICGHLFCKNCIVQALTNAKKCPMCKKALGGRKPYFDIYLSQ